MFDQDQALLDFMTFRTHEAMIFDARRRRCGVALDYIYQDHFSATLHTMHHTHSLSCVGLQPTDHATRNLPRRTQPWVCLATEMQPDENLVRVLRFQHSWIRVPRETRGPGAGGPA